MPSTREILCEVNARIGVTTALAVDHIARRRCIAVAATSAATVIIMATGTTTATVTDDRLRQPYHQPLGSTVWLLLDEQGKTGVSGVGHCDAP